MTVLVTRPDESGQALTQSLIGQGIPALHHALITFAEGRDLAYLWPSLNQCDIAIAISPNAVRFCHQYLHRQGLNWPKSPRYLAIGQKTAHDLSKVTQQYVHYPSVSDSEHFLLLPELTQEQVANKRITILRANSGRDLLKQQLIRRGAQVNYLTAYQKMATTWSAEQQRDIWKKHKVDTIILTSGEQIELFCQPITAIDPKWLSQCTAVVPSERLVDFANQWPWQKIYCSNGASNQQILRTITQFGFNDCENMYDE
ncbi:MULTISPECIES: uroporphyrinogen-III synthase [unclassified Vibrio]|uniref:Uroporphyrinogen-III synthase n=1 Tax=Vibrio sp. HB236076 TaxID=3232307 RepID=A0AB39HF85_9VIBR|nr:uroporphyrinogen-III synthase [Vibrio sp. HB161653]MDP5255707.1 uroporphyrinogen-III synthase [Vibrio sp. HB161653]